MTAYFFETPKRNDELITSNKQLKKLSDEERQQLIAIAIDSLQTIDDWSADNIQATLNQLLETTGQKPGVLFSLIRIVVTWAPFSPELNSTLALLGRDITLSRLQKALD